MMNKRGVVLLSGGLDSYASLDIARKYYDIELALTFNYGQEAFEDEKNSSEKISNLYGIEHKVINLPNLSELKGDEIWIPNRNGLFLNIGGVFCDSKNYSAIIFGGNKEEALNFPDNSIDFVNAINKSLSYSTKCKAHVVAPLIDMTKKDIVEYGIKNGLDFSLIKSCYEGNKNGKKHCGVCPSCMLIKNALIELKREDMLDVMGF